MKRITARQLDIYTVDLVDIYDHLEQEIFMKMAELLKSNAEIASKEALMWQVEKLRQVGALNSYTVKKLAEATDMMPQELARIFNELAGDTIFTVDQQVKQIGLTELGQPTELDSILQQYLENIADDLDNFTNTRLINTNVTDGFVAKIYKDIIDKTTASVIAGNQTVNQAVTKTIIEYRNRGLPTGFVDKGGRRWNIQSYVDLVVRTNANQAYNNISTSRMAEYGIDLVLVDTYAGARPTCARIQGGVCSLSNPSSNPKYPSIYEFGYGEYSGIRGIHCRHSLYPFVDGVSTNNQPQVDVSEANKVYKQMQRQRSLERKVRAAKYDLQIAETTGDEDAINRAKALIRSRQQLVRQWVEETGLARRYDKERVI